MSAELSDLPRIVVSFSWLDRVILMSVGALLGAVFAYANNAVQWRRQKKTETAEHVAREFLRLLDVFDESVKNLWSESRAGLGAGRELALSSSIKTTLSHIEECLKLLFKLKNLERHPQRAAFEEKIKDLGDCATGDLFEMESRSASRETIMRSSSAVLDLRIRFQEFLYR